MCIIGLLDSNDKKAGKYLSIPVYPAPNDKGGFSTHATPTVDGNILVGPDSYLTEGREDYANRKDRLDGLLKDGSIMFHQMKRDYFIRNFAGIRWKNCDEKTGEVLDFILEAAPQNPHTVNLVGIESPGVTCALPLARRAVQKILDRQEKEGRPLSPNASFDSCRKVPRRFSEMTMEERKQAISENPVVIQPLDYAGETTHEKLTRIRKALREQHADGMLMTALDDIAWTLNLRGSDVHCSPVFVSYLLISTTEVTLYINKVKLTPDVVSYLQAEGVGVKSYEEVRQGLKDYFEYNILLDGDTVNYTLYKSVEREIVDGRL